MNVPRQQRRKRALAPRTCHGAPWLPAPPNESRKGHEEQCTPTCAARNGAQTNNPVRDLAQGWR